MPFRAAHYWDGSYVIRRTSNGSADTVAGVVSRHRDSWCCVAVVVVVVVVPSQFSSARAAQPPLSLCSSRPQAHALAAMGAAEAPIYMRTALERERERERVCVCLLRVGVWVGLPRSALFC